MELARGVVIAGKYRLERPLATGGMGSVWVARHTQLETPAAIKFMDAQSASSALARARFEREAKASATLRNRHVVQVLDYGLEGDTPYLVMELLQGEDLSKRLHRERRLSLDAASKVLMQTAKGLRTAHEARVVHRDLKPANIFLARAEDEDEEVIKLLDFGIAKDTAGAVVGEGTKTGELMGSPHYMSPEQVRGARDLDHRSDLWSLSVVMFRVLTGRLPFNGDQIGAVIAQILADPIPVATNLAPDLPRGVDAFFAKGFSRDREERFQTAREMADAFAAIVASAEHPSTARWVVDEPPTRPMMASLTSIEAEQAADLFAPEPRQEMLSIPTESMTPGSLLTPGGPLVGTGGPVIHSAPPPPLSRRSPLRWLPLVGAGIGVLVGAVAFLAVRTSHDARAHRTDAESTPAAGASAIQSAATNAEPPPAPTAAIVAASASAATSASASAPASSASSGSSGSRATPAARPTAAPAKTQQPSAPVVKKKPNWGF